MKNTVVTFKQAKEKGEKLTMLTAYDYSTAKLIDEAGINAILVGDSLGMVVLGYEDTLSVTMEDMIHHSAAVSRGIKDTLLITDIEKVKDVQKKDYSKMIIEIVVAVVVAALIVIWIIRRRKRKKEILEEF